MYTNKSIVATNRFEEIGVKLQENARNFNQSVERFNKSCSLCAMHDYDGRKDCTTCPIREAMLANITWHGVPADHPWVQKELTLA